MVDQKSIRVKNYTGDSESATRSFQMDSIKMGEQGYYPVSQSWTPGSYGCGSFIVALLLCIILIGFLVFIYMLIVKPDGTLTVTYEMRSSPVATESAKVELIFSGQPNLGNDSYVLFLVKKYAIEKNDVLGKYVLNEKLYASIDEALQVGKELEQAEQEQRRESLEQSAIKAKADEAAYREMLTARKSNIKKLLVFLGLMLVIVVIGRVGYLKFHSDEPRSKDSWNSKNEHEMSNKELCDHFLGEEAANPEREKFLEEGIKKYCPLGTLPYWKQPNYGK